jgi:hypothetical protein
MRARTFVYFQVCANELQFLHTPSVLMQIEDTRAQVERILDEYEDMYGTAEEPKPAPPGGHGGGRTSPRELHEDWDRLRAAGSLELLSEQEVRDIDRHLKALGSVKSQAGVTNTIHSPPSHRVCFEPSRLPRYHSRETFVPLHVRLLK